MKTNDKLVHPVDLLSNFADKLFNDKNISSFEELFLHKKQIPPVNIFKTDKGVSIELAIPGFDKKDVEISLEKNLLTISCKKEESSQTFLRNEFSCKSFSRSFNISDGLNTEEIKSSMNNGILTVEIAKLNPETTNTQKKTIPVE